MKKMRTRERLDNEINAGSMADIAFLLLIFFLVTTTIAEDKGILVKLPPWTEDEIPTEMSSRNVYQVLVNAQNELLVRGEPTSINQLKSKVKTFIMNPAKDPTLSRSPSKAVISLKNDRGTSYETYLAVYNELKAAYNELRDEYGKQKYSLAYENCSRAQRDEIKKAIPLIISEAEPTSYGVEN